MIWVTRESPISGRMIKMLIHSSKDEVREWEKKYRNNPSIDHKEYFPNLPDYQIKFLCSGISNSEWDEYFEEHMDEKEDQDFARNRV